MRILSKSIKKTIIAMLLAAGILSGSIMPNTSGSIIAASANTGSVEHRLHYYFLQTDDERACYDAIIKAVKNPLPMGTNIYRMSDEDKIKYGIEMPAGTGRTMAHGIAQNAVEADYPEIIEFVRYSFDTVDVWHDDDNYTSSPCKN